jgi:hypothetical protein
MAHKLGRANKRVFKIVSRLTSKVVGFDVSGILRASSNHTADLPAVMYLFIGMHVRVKKNQLQCKGVTNNAPGIIYYIDWPVGTEFTYDAVTGCYMPTEEPLNVYVQMEICVNKTPYPGLPKHWPNTVVPILREEDSFHWPPGRKAAKISVKINAFPLLCGFDLTCYGIQGNTLDRIVVGEVRPNSYRSPSKCGLYVCLSRARTIDGVLLAEALTEEDYNYFVPPTPC